VELEQFLTEHPRNFYVEHVLSAWHYAQGQVAESERYRELSLAHAPVVLVQKYQREDGAPAANLLVRRFGFELNRLVRDDSEDTIRLEYVLLTTDGADCIHFPVYGTVYRRVKPGEPVGLDADYPRIGFFKPTSRYAELPDATVTRRGPSSILVRKPCQPGAKI
jgi:hypothetical protein